MALSSNNPSLDHGLSTSPAIAYSAKATGEEVWTRLWRYQPSDSKDDQLLEREVSGPRWSVFVREIEGVFGSIEGISTVELGSGRGDLSALLARHGAKVTLLDSNAKALDQARFRFDRLGLSAEFVQQDMLRLDDTFRNRFDVSLSSGVIEHFKGEDRTRVIQAHHDVLTPGGLSMISVPNAWCIPYRVWKFYLEIRGWWPYGMEIPYTKRELLRRATEAGLERSHATCIGFWHSLSAHWARSLFGLGVDWSARRSVLDGSMGSTALMFARRQGLSRGSTEYPTTREPASASGDFHRADPCTSSGPGKTPGNKVKCKTTDPSI